MAFTLLISSLLFIFFLLKWFLTLNSTTNKAKNLPPSPPHLPIVGHLLQLGLYPHRTLRSLAQSYGPIMMLKFGSLPVLVVSSSELAKEIMKTHDLNFSDRPRFNVTDKLLYKGMDVSTAPYGEYWRQMRSICVLQLLSNKRVQSFQSVREEEVSIMIKKIESSSSMSLPTNLSEMFISVTNNVVCRVAFGKKYGDGESGKKFRDLLGELMMLLGSFNVGDFIPWLGWINVVNGFNAKVDRVAREFDEFLEGIVDEKLQSRLNGCANVDENDQDNKDFVHVLLDLQKGDELGNSIDKVSIKALILDMFAAGTDTTYTVLDWTMTELLRNPRIMKQVQNEVRKVTSGEREVSGEDLDKLPYLKAVIRETLRLYPPIPMLVPRLSGQDVNIKGYDIPAGTIVFANAWAIGRDPAVWKHPEEFRPERFLDSSTDFSRQEFDMIPFGAGRRGCPGKSFAMATNELVLANIVNKFDWVLPDETAAENLDMTECAGLAIHRKTPLLAIARTPIRHSSEI